MKKVLLIAILVLSLFACQKETTYEVTFKGDLQVNVKDLIPDYVLDDKTERCILSTGFQSEPFVICPQGDVLKDIEVGHSYVFVIKEKTVTFDRDPSILKEINGHTLFEEYGLEIADIVEITDADFDPYAHGIEVVIDQF